MSILKATKSFTRFKTQKLEMTSDQILERLNLYKIKDIKPEEEVVYGWSSIADTYEPFFDDMSFLTGEYITISMRIDQKKIPSTLLKKEIDRVQKKTMREKEYTKLSRSLKLQIKEAVRANLIKDMKATPNDFDVVIDLSNNIAYLFTTNKTAKIVFEDLMKETFEIAIEMIYPFGMGLQHFEENKLMLLQPANFS